LAGALTPSAARRGTADQPSRSKFPRREVESWRPGPAPVPFDHRDAYFLTCPLAPCLWERRQLEGP
jgi:hypothetical protein